MASRALDLPTQEQCSALTDEQCRRIQEIRDPDGVRNYKNWELENQPDLIRLYMTMQSFPHIEQAMRSRLDWSYKTYANRFKDWRFPVDRGERELAVAELYQKVTAQTQTAQTTPPITSPLPQSQPTPPPIRTITSYPTPPPAIPQRAASFSAPTNDFFVQSPQVHTPIDDGYAYDRMSIETRSTWASGSGASSIFTYNDDTFSNHRSSYATSISSASTGQQSQFSFHQNKPPPLPQLPPPPPRPLQHQPQTLPLNPPKHNPFTGIWNNLLRVIPCQQNHSMVMWHDDSYSTCLVCGFSRWHSLMLNARNIPIDLFMTAMNHLREENRVDYAGNFPIHFLMAAGVSMDYFIQLYQWPNSSAQNVFGQNPLHALDPQNLGESLINFLEWFKTKEHPPGLLLTQRDIYCRTPLHTLFQQPLEQSLYQKILKTFPYAEHQLRSRDTMGRTCIEMMAEASRNFKNSSPASHAKIEAGINEVRVFLSQAELSASSLSTIQRYGFHEIARGARGTSYFGFFQCRICDGINSHSNSYLDQLKCACANGRDRNAPDETGMTPAHAFVLLSRCNNDDAQTPESPAQLKTLFEVLIPRGEPTLREALHSLDPDGNTLVWNVSVRGLGDLLTYILEIEEEPRRKAMVNCCRAVGDGRLMCVLEAVVGRLRDVRNELRLTQLTGNMQLRRTLVEKGNTLLRVRKILVHHGAVVAPDVTTRLRICY